MAQSGRPGRNEPCPCGSGRKYKQCCLARESRPQSDQELSRLRARRAEGRIVELAMRFARDRYGDDLIHEAWDEFWLGSEELALSPEELDREPLFIPWLVFEWIAHPGPDAERELGPLELPHVPLARAYLSAHASRLDAFERRFLLAICASPFSFHLVGEVRRGIGFATRDLFTGAEHWVAEHAGSEMVERGDALFAKIVAHDDIAQQVGMGGTRIPPDRVLELLDTRDRLAGPGEKLATEELRELETVLRDRYLALRHSLHHPQLPRLRNTDGDDFVPTTLRYALHCSPREAFDALASLSVVSTPEELLDESTLDASGELIEAEIVWSKRGNRVNRSWDNTILGSLSISAAKLEVTVNSVKRARRIEREIRRRLGERAKLDSKTHESIDKLHEERRAQATATPPALRPADDDPHDPPEFRELLAQHAREHWESWPDHELPALLGSTPREAAKDGALRERLEALLVHFEREFRDPEFRGLGCDVAELRRRLGM